MKLSEARAIADEESAAYIAMQTAIARFEAAQRAYIAMPLSFEPDDD